MTPMDFRTDSARPRVANAQRRAELPGGRHRHSPARRHRLYSEVNFFTPGAANLIGVGPAVFLFRYYTAVRCTVSVACVA